MDQQWRIKVIEKKRKEVDRALLLQAIIALAKHLETKKRNRTTAEAEDRTEHEDAS